MTDNHRPRKPPSEASQRRRRQASRQDYEVGYGKPPKETRFKAGESGNRKGRPKRHRNLKTVLEEALREKVTIREGERRRTIARIDVWVRTVLGQALRGEAKGTQNLLGLIRVAGLAGNEAEAASAEPARYEDEALIKDFLRRFGAATTTDVEDLSKDDEDNEEPTRNCRSRGGKR